MKPGTGKRSAARDDGLGRRLAEAESELAKARETLSNLLEDAPLGVHRYRLFPDGRLVFLGGNRAAIRILGMRHEDLVGRTIEEAFPPLAASDIPAAYRGVVESGRSYQKEHSIYKDERIDSVYDIAAFKTGPEEMAVFFRDITAQKKAEEELRAKTEELDRYFTHSLDLLCIADTDGLFRRLNPEWEKTLGWPVAELTGRRFLDFVHPEDVASTVAAVATLSSQTKVLNFVNRFRCRDGTYRWIEWRSYPQGKLIYAVARDVTEQKRVEAALRESEGRLSSIFRASPIGIGLTIHRVIKEVNECICSMLGRGREELVGRSTRILYADDAEFDRAGRELKAVEGRMGIFEARWVRKDGTIIDVMIGVAPIDAKDPAAGIAFTGLDISRSKRAEEERRVIEAQMRQTQKLESLGVLAGGIAHDFNNILMAILGHAELAQTHLDPASPARENLREIQESALRASDLVRQILAYSGKGRFRVERLDLNDVIRETARMLEVSVSKKARLLVRPTPDLPSVKADAAQLRQVIMNLVINASEAIGDAGGAITVTTGSTSADRCPSDGWVDGAPAGGQYVRLEVEDTGIGMDEATKARIFDPFFSTKFTGRGLGLAAVIGIVRGHGGALRVRSAPGKGTVFTVLLPAEDGPALSRNRTPARSASWRGGGTVLLVDDEETVREVGTRMLEHLGFRVSTAADGREAVDILREKHAEIRCVIMDLTMPLMGGEESFLAMRRIDPSVRILLSSGYEEPDAVRRFSAQGLAGFIHKPYQMSTLIEALRNALKD